MDIGYGIYFSISICVSNYCEIAWIGQAAITQEWSAQEALQLFQHSVDLSLGSQWLEGNYGMAVNVWRQLFQQPPSTPAATFASGSASSIHALAPSSSGGYEGNYRLLDEAVLALRKSIEQDDSDLRMLELLALLLERQRQFEEAERYLRIALRLDGTTADCDRLLVSLGRVLCAQRKFEEARESFTKLTCPPTAPITQISYGLTLYFCGAYEESVSLLQSAARDPLSSTAVNQRAIICLARVLFAGDSSEHRKLAIERLLQW
jgi:tetratricopeptide (TPR) repeat protein